MSTPETPRASGATLAPRASGATLEGYNFVVGAFGVDLLIDIGVLMPAAY